MRRTKGVKGYKAFEYDNGLVCTPDESKPMRYKVGKTYNLDGELKICENGFHFCKTIADCYSFYSMSENTHICEICALGDIVEDKDGIKFATNCIQIVKEIKNPKEKSNINKTSTGYRNSGDWNSGNCNSGNYNSGDLNSGNRNSGDCNSGNRNSGDCNSGNCNSGNYNSGHYNSGHYNSGHYNSGNFNSGCFCTDKYPKIKLFDKESDWTIDDWFDSKAYDILCELPCAHSKSVSNSDMTDKEKQNHPEYKTTGYYIKKIEVTADDKQKWWDELSEDDKAEIYKLPNFDADKFCECIGIHHI